MSRKFISLVVAASVAVAGLTATQAQALDKRTRNVILGATALAILGAASSDRKADTVTRQTHAKPKHDHRHGNKGWHTHGNVHHRHDNANDHGRIRDRTRTYDHGRTRDRDRAGDRDRRRPAVTPRPLPDRVFRSELPRRCKLTIQNRRGTHKIFEKRCLERNYSQVHRLPDSCRVKVRAGGRKIRGYDARCVKQHIRDARWLNH